MRSALDRARGQAAVDLLLAGDEDDEHRDHRQDDAGADQVIGVAERAGKRVQRCGDRHEAGLILKVRSCFHKRRMSNMT